MPEKWNHPQGALEVLDGPVQIQQRRAKKHVTVFSRNPNAPGAGKPIVKQIFTECAKETRNEPIKAERNRIISECMKAHKEEIGEPGLNIRESRGKFAETINGKPGLKGTFLVNGIENGERISALNARMIRSGQSIDALPEPDDMTNEYSVETVPVSSDVKALLCQYDAPMDRYQKAIETKDYAGSAMIEQEMRDISDCEACHGIIDQVVEDAVKWSECTDNCDALLKAFQATIIWAKDALCPDRLSLNAGQAGN